MLDYILEIIIPFVEGHRDLISKQAPAVVIIDNFKGQVTPAVTKILEENGIHMCLLPPNTTDKLQPLDVAVNKPVKDFLRLKFQEWYAEEIGKQLQDVDDVEEAVLEPINLSLPLLREKGAKWLVEMFDYITDNPSIIVNGFVKSGILRALSNDNKGETDDSEEDDLEKMSGTDDELSEYED